ncbi:GtrA family protein [Cohnella sp. WQ 127256]|uniref:GtrA family protein n=1 Tax=Cohnella sp. WQ 127256 TaxID=2938790 RepID=UPI0021196ECA|nr:GtrA family protein [Cohnella sp. WQ 127256]
MLRLSEGKRMAKYTLVGGLNTGVDFAIFCLLVYGLSMGSIGAQLISYLAGVVNSYLLNRYWTFQVKSKRSMTELIRFILVNVLSFAAATLVLLSLEQWGVETAFAKIVSIFCSLVVNYAGYRLWVFKGMNQQGNQASEQ